ncbi:MAG: gfo/Idh/MocA family oxidoreductase [Planctomycetota bacterium]|nr:MAG: gfo/Idh/MocA family oxidoreductase [Planctomycetota bacterium]
MSDWTRRDFIRTAAGTGIAATVLPSFASGWTNGGMDTVRIGVIGCGGRGTGAAYNALEAHPSTRIVAMADLFEDRLNGSLGWLSESEDFAGRIDVGDRKFVGFDAYQQLLTQKDIDLVILATPPGFRPMHFEAAVNAGKHVFMEKPVAVDPAGVRTVIAAAERAKAQKLSVVAGTQRRHEPCYREAIQRLRNGDIGEVVSARCAWNQGGLWVHERKPEYSDMEWQCRNWLYFCWLSGDHICEQHIHNLDVVNWALGAHPTSAYGMGGRQVRTDAKYGNIFDHFAIEYEYPDGRQALSFCRQQDGTDGRVEETIFGTKGSLTTRPGYAAIGNGSSWRFSGDNGNPYVHEHANLLASVRGDGPYLNEGVRVAESTLTAIMGRMSAYTGKRVTWEQAMNSSLDLSPPDYAFGDLPIRPVPEPGRTPLI